MRDIYEVAYDLEVETAYLELPRDFDFTSTSQVETLPPSEYRQEMLTLLGQSSHTSIVNHLSKSECYKYLKYAKKWVSGYKEDPILGYLKELAQDSGKKFRLCGCTLPELRQLVLSLFPTHLPTLCKVTYHDMQKVLRILKKFKKGIKVKLSGTTQEMYDQMVRFYGSDWETRWDTINTEADTYLNTLAKAQSQIKTSKLLGVYLV